MSEWVDITSFNADDIESDTKDGNVTGGSGDTPSITVYDPSYYLYTPDNVVITDHNGEPLTTEGLT